MINSSNLERSLLIIFIINGCVTNEWPKSPSAHTRMVSGVKDDNRMSPVYQQTDESVSTESHKFASRFYSGTSLTFTVSQANAGPGCLFGLLSLFPKNVHVKGINVLTKTHQSVRVHTDGWRWCPLSDVGFFDVLRNAPKQKINLEKCEY